MLRKRFFHGIAARIPIPQPNGPGDLSLPFANARDNDPDVPVARFCAGPGPTWPPKYDLFGVQVGATNYAEATGAIIEAARRRQPAVVSLHATHALITASGDPALRKAVNTFEMLGPDGQPVRWALNLLHRVGFASGSTGRN